MNPSSMNQSMPRQQMPGPTLIPPGKLLLRSPFGCVMFLLAIVCKP